VKGNILWCYHHEAGLSGDCWKEAGRVRLPDGASISCLTGDDKGKMLWAVIQPYNLIMSVDIDNRVCRTCLPCLPIHEKAKDNRIKAISVSGNKVYIVYGNELFEMPR